MKTKYCRAAILSIVLVTLFASTLPTHAQEICFSGLTPAECQLLTDARTANYKSFLMDYQVALKVSGFTPKDLTFSVKGTGGIDTSKVADISTNPTSLVLWQRMHLNWAMNNDPHENDLEYRYVAGQLYMIDTYGTKGQWVVGAPYDLDDLRIAVAVPFSVLNSAKGPLTADAIRLAFKTVSDPAIVKVEHKTGDIVDGQPTEQFLFTINTSALTQSLSQSDNRPLLKAIVEYAYWASWNGIHIDPSTLQQIVLTLEDFAPLLQNANFTVMLRLGAQDERVQCICVDFAANLDAPAASLISRTGGKPLSIDAEFMLNLSKIGEAVNVEPVANAIVTKPRGSC